MTAISPAVIRDLLTDACRAPSGDNVQPWRFRWNGSLLSIYNLPGIHNPYLDFEERGSYIAHGALIENLCISAPHYGYQASVEIFPSPSDTDLVAQARFTECEPYDDPLYMAIRARVTNHHPFKNRPLTEEERSAFEGSVASLSGIEVRLVTERKGMSELGYVASRAEIVVLEDERVAEHFFSGMVWTEKEEKAKRRGFYVKTLEFNPIQNLLFWLASKPTVRKLFSRIGLPRFIAYQDAQLYATGSVAGGILLTDESAKSYLTAGRALERLWLTATALGLAFQPLIGMVFIAYRSETGRGTLSLAHAAEMQEALVRTRTVLGGTGKIPALLFHAGVAPAPSVRTSRRQPDIEFV